MQLVLVLVGITIVLVGIAVVIVMLRQPDRGLRARGIARVAASSMGVFAIVFGTFVAGETFMVAGRASAPWLVLAWLAPMILLSAFAWVRPAWATPVLVVLTAVIALAAAWFVLAPNAWRAFENDIGPIRALAMFALGVALVTLGLRVPGVAGWMLLALGIVPVAVSSFGSLADSSSLAVVSFMPVITGLLFVASDRMSRHAVRESAPAGQVPRAKTS